MQVHLGGCGYAFPFEVTVPGVYRVLALATRTDWRSLNESIAGYPPLTRDDLLGERALIELGSGVGEADSEAARVAVRAAAGLLVCDTDALLRGRWVRASTVVGMFSERAPWFWSRWWIDRDPPNGLGARYWTDLSRDLFWTPYVCAAPLLDAGAARAFLAGKRMNFRGDSQLRLVYNHLMRVVCGSTEAASKDQKLTDDVVANAPDCPGLIASFTHDMMGEQPYSLEPAAEPASLLVVNFGQHHASGRARAPLLVYEADLERYWTAAAAETAAKAPRSGAAGADFRAIWVDTFPMCVRNDDFVWGYGDWRTPLRIHAYNAAARRVVGPHASGGGPLDAYVGVYELLRQICDVCPDGAHFIDVFPVLDFLVALLMQHLGGAGLLLPTQ